jgi:hypothetical protein
MPRALGVEGTLHHFFCLALLVRAQSDHVFPRRSPHRRWECPGETKTRPPERERGEGREPGGDATGVPQAWSPVGKPQSEDLGCPCGCGRHRPRHCSFCRGSSGRWWWGRPEEARVWSPKGKREEGGDGCSGCSLAGSPPWTAAGQQEQENSCSLRGDCLRDQRARRGSFFAGWSVLDSTDVAGALTAGLHLGRRVVHFHRPGARRGQGPSPPSISVRGSDGGAGDGLRYTAGVQRWLAQVPR